jgi:hypothetical protein
MYKIVFAGKEDCGFFIDKDVDSYNDLIEAIAEFKQYGAIKDKPLKILREEGKSDRIGVRTE